MTTSRRRFLAGAAASGAVLVARPTGILADVLGGTPQPTVARRSKLFPNTWLVHADLHNHTLFSDGDGDPAAAFASMRSSGLDVAALTDHAVLGGALGAVASVCGAGCTSVRGIDEASWQHSQQLADDADDPGTFTAIRGFEWSSPTLGHVNVWFGQDWIDPERTGGLVGVEGIPGLLDQIPEVGAPVGEPLESLVTDLPTTGLSMAGFYAWLRRQPGGLLGGGGADALAGFNHPGREPGRFAAFAYDARMREKLVSLELFNRDQDYLYEGIDAGRTSPLVQCLDAGWRPGLLGVTDEHGTDWGRPLDKGRAGLWVGELSRGGVRWALSQRRFFATRERGLRVDASLKGVRMGGVVPHRSGKVTVKLDIEGPSVPAGTPLVVQVLRSGSPVPVVTAEHHVIVPAADAPPIRFPAAVDVAGGEWVVLRIVDPARAGDPRAPTDLGGHTIAYPSPWYLDPTANSGE
ncbi:MAG TPA: DUF3604 domain-containing protein [Iamia sp.]